MPHSMTTLEEKHAVNSHALITFDQSWAINRANKAAAYLFVPLTKEELGSGLYNILKCRNLLTLNEIRKLDLGDFATLNHFGAKKLSQLKKLVEAKNGWFYNDHQSPEVIETRMTKQQELQTEQKIMLTRPDSKEEKAYQAQLQNISVLNLFSEHPKLYNFFQIHAETLHSHTTLKNQLVSAQISDKSFSLYELSLFSSSELKDLGVGQKSAARFTDMIHQVGGRFKDDPLDENQYTKLAEFNTEFGYITDVSAKEKIIPKKKEYIDRNLAIYGENHKDIILKKIEDIFPDVPEETLQKLQKNAASNFIGDLILDGIPDNAGLDQSEVALLQKNAEDIGIELNILQRLEKEYDSEYPKMLSMEGVRINRLLKRFKL